VHPSHDTNKQQLIIHQMVHKHRGKSQYQHQPAFTQQYFLPLQDSDRPAPPTTSHIISAWISSSTAVNNVRMQSTSDDRATSFQTTYCYMLYVNSRRTNTFNISCMFYTPTTLILSTYFHRYFIRCEMFVHSFYYFVITRRHLAKLYVNSCVNFLTICVLPDDGFLNKPKRVVTNYFIHKEKFLVHVQWDLYRSLTLNILMQLRNMTVMLVEIPQKNWRKKISLWSLKQI
jgi:hypothetical protein